VRLTHELKIWPVHFDAVQNEGKRAEVRKDDRDYQAGDRLVLREWDPANEAYTGRGLVTRTRHVLRDAPGLAPGFVVLSIVDPRPVRAIDSEAFSNG